MKDFDLQIPKIVPLTRIAGGCRNLPPPRTPLLLSLFEGEPPSSSRFEGVPSSSPSYSFLFFTATRTRA